jgi:hypothetical protein
MSQNPGPPGAGSDAFGTLRRFVRPRPAAEQCDLCAAPIPPDPHHAHLIEPATRQLLCACEACAILFSGQADTRYRRVPRRVRALPDFRLTDAQWDALLIPVGMAFFFSSSPEKRVLALYPSPAGATESLLPLETWTELVQDNPALAGMEPDVEALLVNRIRGHQEYYLVPIDECYRLVGLIRAGWRGLSGGSAVWQEIDNFFQQLQQRSGGPAPPRGPAGDESRA